MNSKTLKQAVEDEVLNNLIANKKEFSSHDVTVLIRQSIDRMEYDVTDCNQASFSGKQTRYISHDSVKPIVKSICDKHPDYFRKWVPVMGSGHFLYCPKNGSAQQTPTPQHPNSNVVPSASPNPIPPPQPIVTAVQTPQSPSPSSTPNVAQSQAITNAADSLFAVNDD